MVNLIRKLPALNAAVEKAIDEIEFSEHLEFDSENLEDAKASSALKNSESTADTAGV